MRPKKYKVNLTKQEQNELLSIVNNSENKAKKIRRAHILLQLDETNGITPMQSEIAKMYQTTTQTVYLISKQYVEEGLAATLNRKVRNTPPIATKITGDVEARIIAIACSEAPEGRSRWTLRLIASKAIELKIVESVSYKTVGEVLKKRAQTTSS